MPTLLAIYAKPDVPDRRRYFEWHLENLARWERGENASDRIERLPPELGASADYDPETLLAMIQEAGFEQVSECECELQRSADHRLAGLEYHTRMLARLLALHTMTFEAVKR